MIRPGALLAILCAPAGQGPASLPVEIRTLAGETVAARVLGFEPGEEGGGVLVLEGAAAPRLDLEKVARMRLPGAATLPAGELRDGLWLRSGAALPAEAIGRGGRFRSPLTLEPFEVLWRHVAAVRLAARPRDPDGGFRARLAEPPPEQDLLYYLAGDRVKRITVQFEDLEPDAVVVRFRGRRQRMPRERAYGIVFGSLRGAPPAPFSGIRVRVGLRGGRRLEGRLVGWSAGRVDLLLAEGARLALRAAWVEALTVLSDRMVELGDLEVRVEQTPGLDRVWPVVKDRMPGGGPIRMGGRTWDRGFVVVPRARLIFDLGGRFDRFEAVVGMADGAGEAANAVLRVSGDGAVLFDSGPLTAASPPRPVELSIAGVRRLVLEADFGANLDLGDLCVFAEPRVSRVGPVKARKGR